MTSVSVVIATVDRPERVRRCITALGEGTLRPAEVIVVDQSDDTGTFVAAAELDAGTMPVRYVHRDTRGVSAARNDGIRRASSSVVAFTDDDCVPARDWVATLVEAMADPAIDAVAGRVLALGEAEAGTYTVSLQADERRRTFRGRTIPWYVGTGGNLAVRRELLTTIGGFDERLGPGTRGAAAEDLDLVYRILVAGASILHEPAAVVYHERATRARRLAAVRAYGCGMGAMTAQLLRAGDPYACRILARWSFDKGRRTVARSRAREPGAGLEARLMLRGLASGLRAGARRRDARAGPPLRVDG